MQENAIRSLSSAAEQMTTQEATYLDEDEVDYQGSVDDQLVVIHERWSRVQSGLPSKRAATEEALRNISLITADMDALSSWVVSTKVILEQKKGPTGSSTSQDMDDSIVVDPAVSYFSLHKDRTLLRQSFEGQLCICRISRRLWQLAKRI